MDINEIRKQVSQNMKENISLRKEIKEGLSSWKRKLFGSKKEETNSNEDLLQANASTLQQSQQQLQQPNQQQQETQDQFQISDIPQNYNINNLTKQQIESIERLNEVLQQSVSNKISVKQIYDKYINNKLQYKQKAFKTLQKWYLVMINEPSIGMYYIQDHNANIIQHLHEDKKELQKMNRKLKFTTEQLNNTKKELKDISRLNGEWSNNMAQLIDRLGKASV